MWNRIGISSDEHNQLHMCQAKIVILWYTVPLLYQIFITSFISRCFLFVWCAVEWCIGVKSHIACNKTSISSYFTLFCVCMTMNKCSSYLYTAVARLCLDVVTSRMFGVVEVMILIIVLWYVLAMMPHRSYTIVFEASICVIKEAAPRYFKLQLKLSDRVLGLSVLCCTSIYVCYFTLPNTLPIFVYLSATTFSMTCMVNSSGLDELYQDPFPVRKLYAL